MLPFEKRIFEKVSSAFAPLHIELVNESSNHGRAPEAESHFRLILVSHAFADQSRIQRHRSVNEELKMELAERVHALSIQAFTPEEWIAKGGKTFASPECAHGAKR